MSNGDPPDGPRGKDRSERKGRYDGGWTGSERRIRDQLMRQFMKTGEGPGGNGDAYRNAPCWCACGRLKADGDDVFCARCRVIETAADQRQFFPQNDEPFDVDWLKKQREADAAKDLARAFPHGHPGVTDAD